MELYSMGGAYLDQVAADVPSLDSSSGSRSLLDCIEEEQTINAPELRTDTAVAGQLLHGYADFQSNKKRRHIAGHACHICNTSYTEQRTLRRHLRTPAHCRRAGLPVHKYPCPQCNKHFTRVDILHRHFDEVHRGFRRGTPSSLPAPYLFDSCTAGLGICSDGDSLNDLLMPAIVSGQEFPSEPLLISNDGHSNSYELPQSGRIVFERDKLTWPGATSGELEASHSFTTEPCSSVTPLRAGGFAEHSHQLQDESMETASIASISTISSIKSYFSAKIPFRSRLLTPKDGTYINPRPRQLRSVHPCPLCKKELGDTGEKVKEHMDRHLQELSAAPGSIFCETCQVSFVHEKDLRWHIQSASATRSCGFDFQHNNNGCDGHHPPNSDYTAHKALTNRLRQWEAMQLAEYRSYIDRHANGLVPTNAPYYDSASRAMFRVSTGSLFSVRSYLSWRSASDSHADILLGSRFNSKPPLKSFVDTAYLSIRGTESALRRAIGNEDLGEVRRLLLKQPILPLTTFLRIISEAILHLDGDILSLLLDTACEIHPKTIYRYIEVSHDFWEPLCHYLDTLEVQNLQQAFIVKLANCIKQLIDIPITLNSRAVVAMIRAGIPELVEAMIESGACFDTRNNSRRSPIMSVLTSSLLDPKIIPILFSKGDRLNCRDLHGKTTLMYAAIAGDCATLTSLLDHGARLESQDVFGQTALMHAALTGRVNAVRLLLERDATPDLEDIEGKSALYLAASRTQTQVVETFREYGVVSPCRYEAWKPSRRPAIQDALYKPWS